MQNLTNHQLVYKVRCRQDLDPKYEVSDSKGFIEPYQCVTLVIAIPPIAHKAVSELKASKFQVQWLVTEKGKVCYGSAVSHLNLYCPI